METKTLEKLEVNFQAKIDAYIKIEPNDWMPLLRLPRNVKCPYSIILIN